MGSEAAAEAAASSWAVGQEVLAFYHANDHPEGYRYVRVHERTRDFPIVGLTSGWLPGTVVDTDPPASRDQGGDSAGRLLQIFFPGTFRHPHEGYCEGMDMLVPGELVKPLSDSDLEERAPEQPLLSIVLFRWYDYWSNTRWSDYSVTNDGMLIDLFEGPFSVREQLPGEFEVYTVFVRRTDDLPKINPARLRSMLKGQSVTAWYFLWPVMSGDIEGRSGCVRERDFFLLCQRMERAAIRGVWPHPSDLYRRLCGKLWVSQMCLNRDYRLPPTTRLHYAEFRQDPRRAAARAVAAVMRIRRAVWGRQPVPPDDFAGVVKLGFSWQGDDVLPFRGISSLVANLGRLFEQTSSEQTTCLVQELVPRVVGEHRILAFRDAAQGHYRRERLWLRMKGRGRHHVHKCDLGDFSLASAYVIPPHDVTAELFGGDCSAQQVAEEEVQHLVDRWLRWFSAECSEPPAVTRLDFLVAHSGPGCASVWTCEVGECGASLCSVEVDARNAAAVNAAVSLGAGSQQEPRFPAALPETICRNNGWKS